MKQSSETAIMIEMIAMAYTAGMVISQAIKAELSISPAYVASAGTLPPQSSASAASVSLSPMSPSPGPPSNTPDP